MSIPRLTARDFEVSSTLNYLTKPLVPPEGDGWFYVETVPTAFTQGATLLTIWARFRNRHEPEAVR